MSSTPKTSRPAVRSPIAKPVQPKTAPAKAAAKSEPMADPFAKNEFQKKRDADAFQAIVIRMPEPQALDPRILSARGAQALESCDKLLSGFVTSGNVKEALSTLNTLESRDFGLVMDRLASSGRLKELTDSGSRSQFLSMAASKGYVGTEARTAQAGKFDPPTPPTLYKMDSRLPLCVNDAIHAESKQQYAAYREAFNAYLGRFDAAVKATKNMKELVAIGKAVEPSSTRELTGDVFGADRYRKDNFGALVSSDGALKAIQAQVEKLGGGRQDGSGWLEAQGSFVDYPVLGIGGVAWEGAASSDGVRDEKVGPAFRAGPYSTKRFGEVSSEKVSVGGIEVERERKGDVLEKIGVKVKLGAYYGEFGLERGGALSVGGGVSAEVGESEATAGGSLTIAPHWEWSLGVVGEVKVDGLVEAKGRAAAGTKGISQETIRKMKGASMFDGK
jgi:hypothetical protein